MTVLSITATDVAPVEIYEKITAPAAEALDAGEMVRLDTSTGKLTPGNASSTAESLVLGMAIDTADFAGETIT